MLRLQFKESDDSIAIEFSKASDHVVTIKSDENVPQQTTGFYIFRDEVPEDKWDYTAFNTVYRAISSKEVQFSDDGSKYVAPTQSFTTQAVWNDGNDVYGIRPDSIIVDVYNNGKKSGQDTLAPSEKEWKNWKVTHNNKPITNVYTAVGPELPGYTKSESGTVVTYTIVIPEPRQVTTDDVAKALLEFAEYKEPNAINYIYAAYCEQNSKNFNDVPDDIQDAVRAIIEADHFMVNEDGTTSLAPINLEG